MCFGETTSNLLLTDRGSGLLVTSEMAELVIEELWCCRHPKIDSPRQPPIIGPESPPDMVPPDDSSTTDPDVDSPPDPTPPAGPKRIVVTKRRPNKTTSPLMTLAFITSMR